MLKKLKMIKQFRQHRGSLDESLKTSVEVSGIEDIRKYLDTSILKNIKIKNDPITDNRLSENCGNIVYKVVADFGEYKEQCVGFCNFYEE